MTTISPVTENDMRGFFERVATQFVELSAQAQELITVRRDAQDLASKISSMNSRLDALEAENGKLKAELSDTWEFAHKIETDLAVAKRDITDRDYTISDLGQKLHEQSRAYNHVTSEREEFRDKNMTLNNEASELRAKVAELEKSNATLQQAVTTVENDRSYWRSRALQAEKATDEAERKLREANSALDTIRSALKPLTEANLIPATQAVNDPEPPEPTAFAQSAR